MHKKEAPLHHGREVESPELGGLRAKFRRWPDTKCLFFSAASWPGLCHHRRRGWQTTYQDDDEWFCDFLPSLISSGRYSWVLVQTWRCSKGDARNWRWLIGSVPHIPSVDPPVLPQKRVSRLPVCSLLQCGEQTRQGFGGQLLRPGAHGEGLRKGRNHTNRPQSEASLQRMNLTLAGEVGRPER